MMVVRVRWLIMVMVLVGACAPRFGHERMRPLAGQWETDRGIVMSLRSAPGGSFVAEIVKAPGFTGEGYQPGRILISNIEPLVDNGYRGVFLMPGAESVPVRINVIDDTTLLIALWNFKKMGAAMKWHRINRESPY